MDGACRFLKTKGRCAINTLFASIESFFSNAAIFFAFIIAIYVYAWTRFAPRDVKDEAGKLAKNKALALLRRWLK